MPKISHAAIQASYDIAKKVNTGQLSLSRGLDILAADYNLNRSSASDYIHNYAHLINGERFTRTINAYAAEYFLTKILGDGGVTKLTKALQSLRQHIDYYDGLQNGRLRKLQTIYEDYLNRLSEYEVPSTARARYFLQYWLEKQLDTELAIKAPLVHSGSNQFDRVSPGDVVWIVSLRNKGGMVLVGPILVDRIVNHQDAIKLFGPGVWDASHHIVAKEGSETQIRETSIIDSANKLRFVSKLDRLKVINGRVDGKQIQRLRELTTTSAELLYSIWSDDGVGSNTDGFAKFEKAIQAGAGFGDPVRNKMVETAAVEVVTRDYELRGWSVVSVEREKCGFDLRCIKGSLEKHVEVKGVGGRDLSFIITRGERDRAKRDEQFVICIVTSALTLKPQLHSFQGFELLRRFSFEPLAYRVALANRGRLMSR